MPRPRVSWLKRTLAPPEKDSCTFTSRSCRSSSKPNPKGPGPLVIVQYQNLLEMTRPWLGINTNSWASKTWLWQPNIQFRSINVLSVFRIPQFIHPFGAEFSKCWNLLFLLFISPTSLSFFLAWFICFWKDLLKLSTTIVDLSLFPSSLCQLFLLIFWDCTVNCVYFENLFCSVVSLLECDIFFAA